MVTEPIEVLYDIVDAMTHVSLEDKLATYLLATIMFPKYWFDHYVQISSKDYYTPDLKYILGKIFESSVHTCNKNGFTFVQCILSFLWVLK